MRILIISVVGNSKESFLSPLVDSLFDEPDFFSLLDCSSRLFMLSEGFNSKCNGIETPLDLDELFKENPEVGVRKSLKKE